MTQRPSRQKRQGLTIRAIKVTTIAWLLALFCLPSHALATDFYVGSTADTTTGTLPCDELTDNCTIRQAITAANSDASTPHTIHIPSGTYNTTSAYPTITKSMTIQKDYSDTGTTVIDGGGGTYNHITFIFDSAGDTLNLKNLTIQNVTTTLNPSGAGAYVISGSLNIYNCTFSYCINTYGGGAIHINTTGGSLSIDNSNFSNNEATLSNYGGAVKTLSPATINNSSFIGNKGAGLLGAGAIAMYDANATLEITNSTFDQNTSIRYGGAIYSICSINPAIIITDSTFTNNQATDTATYTGGGAIRSDSGSVTISGSLFNSNSSATGGAIRAVKGITVKNSTFSANSINNASGTGGAIYNSSTCTIQNTTFYNNTTGANGLGTSINTTVSCSVANNIYENNLNYTNCKGTTSSTGNSIDNVAGGSCWTTGTAGQVKTSAEINLNPTLALNGSVTTMTHALNSGSHAINAGDTTTCSAIGGIDQRGKYRDANCDIGAYEYLDYATTNTAPVGGYSSDNIIPAAQINDDASDGTGGEYTITWKGYDAEDTNVVLKSFRYSIDSGSTWHTLGDTSEALSVDWNSEVHSVSTSFGASTAHTFNFNTKHSDVNSLTPTLTSSTISTVKISFKLYDGEDESAWVNSEVFTAENGSGNTPPVGGYTADDVIPTAQVVQAKDGTGIVTVTFKGKDAETNNVTLSTFEYSLNGGTWTAPTNNDASNSLATYWEDKDGSSGYNTETDFTSASPHSFTFNLEHGDVAALNDVESNNLKIRFTLNDGTVDSDNPATSESFNIDTLAPACTITGATYDPATNKMTIDGTNFTGMAAASTDVKTYVDWTKFIWDINNDGATSGEINFAAGNVESLIIFNSEILNLTFTAAKASAIESTSGFGNPGGADTLAVAAGFCRDDFGNAATTDAYDSLLYVKSPVIEVTKVSSVIYDPINGSNGKQKRIPGAVIEYIISVNNNGDASPDADSIIITDNVDGNLAFNVNCAVIFTNGTGNEASGLTLGTVTFSDDPAPGPYTYDYTPTGPVDDAVTSFKAPTSGTFAFNDEVTVNPGFTLKYQTLIN